jgi:hypothetical protein
MIVWIHRYTGAHERIDAETQRRTNVQIESRRGTFLETQGRTENLGHVARTMGQRP